MRNTKKYKEWMQGQKFGGTVNVEIFVEEKIFTFMVLVL